MRPSIIRCALWWIIQAVFSPGRIWGKQFIPQEKEPPGYCDSQVVEEKSTCDGGIKLRLRNCRHARTGRRNHRSSSRTLYYCEPNEERYHSSGDGLELNGKRPWRLHGHRRIDCAKRFYEKPRNGGCFY